METDKVSRTIRIKLGTFSRLQAVSEPFISVDTAINMLLDELDKHRSMAIKPTIDSMAKFLEMTIAGFPSTTQNRRGTKAGHLTSPGSKALAALTVGTSFSVPCEWEHKPSGTTPTCPGQAKYQSLGGSVRRHADPTLRIKTRCRDGILRILRVEDYN
jgi:hypothetical protein